MDHHELLQLACQNRHEQPPAPVRPHPPRSNGPARPLPITVSPVSGETPSSYPGRVAAANHITATALLALLPRWFRTKIRDCDDRGQHAKLLPAAAGALHQLATVTGSTSKTLAHALPVFTYFTGDPPDQSGRPQPASGAGRQRIHQPIPHLPGGTPEDLLPPPAMAPGQRPAPARSISLPGHHRRPAPGPAPAAPLHPQQLISAQVAAVEHITGPEPDPQAQPANWQQRVSLLHASNTRPGSTAPTGTSSSRSDLPRRNRTRDLAARRDTALTQGPASARQQHRKPAGRTRRDDRTPNPRQTTRRPEQMSRNSP